MKNNIKEETEPQTTFIYQILTGDSEDEFYTFTLPFIETQPISDSLVCINTLKKAVVREMVLENQIEEFYAVEATHPQGKSTKELKFDLKTGIVLKLIPVANLNWLNKTQKEAEEQLKDRVLNFYKTTVPNLVQSVEALKQEINMIRGQRNTNNGNVRSDFNKRDNLLI